MAASLSKSFADLRREIGYYLGFGASVSDWTADAVVSQQIEDILKTGLCEFYWYDPPEGLTRHSWSFLKPTVVLSLVSGTDIYDLPADFGGLYQAVFTFTDNTGQPIKLVSESELRTVVAREGKSGTPQFCAIRSKAQQEGFEGTYEVQFYPSPDAAAVLRYRYELIPGLISTDNQYPYGSRLHSNTILEFCLAAGARKYNDSDENEPHHRASQRSLLSSVDADYKLSEEAAQGVLWTSTDDKPSMLPTRGHLRRRIGLHGYNKPNPKTWSADEEGIINEALIDAFRRMYYPIQADGQKFVHQWSFMYPLSYLNTTANTDIYDLPLDFSDIRGPLTLAPGTTNRYPPIEIVSEAQLRAARQHFDHTGRPRLAALRTGPRNSSTGSSYQLIFFPVPDDAYRIDYRYQRDPEWLTTDGEFPDGGVPHAQTLVHACLASIDGILNKPSKYHETRFIEQLARSIAHDQQMNAPDSLGRDRDNSDVAAGDDIDNYYHPYQSGNFVTYNGVVP